MSIASQYIRGAKAKAVLPPEMSGVMMITKGFVNNAISERVLSVDTVPMATEVISESVVVTVT